MITLCFTYRFGAILSILSSHSPYTLTKALLFNLASSLTSFRPLPTSLFSFVYITLHLISLHASSQNENFFQRQQLSRSQFQSQRDFLSKTNIEILIKEFSWCSTETIETDLVIQNILSKMYIIMEWFFFQLVTFFFQKQCTVFLNSWLSNECTLGKPWKSVVIWHCMRYVRHYSLETCAFKVL